MKDPAWMNGPDEPDYGEALFRCLRVADDCCVESDETDGDEHGDACTLCPEFRSEYASGCEDDVRCPECDSRTELTE